MPATAPEQLAIHSTRLVSFGGKDVKATLFGNAATQNNIRSTPGHIGGDGDSSRLTRACDDLSLLGLAHRIEHLMIEPPLSKHG